MPHAQCGRTVKVNLDTRREESMLVVNVINRKKKTVLKYMLTSRIQNCIYKSIK